MENTSKGNFSIYLFNAYSNLNPELEFISGSDRVGIELIKQDPSNVYVMAPLIFKKLVPNHVNFIATDTLKINNLYFRYLYRCFKSFSLIKKLMKDFEGPSKSDIKIVSTSDFFPDVLPAFFFSNQANWFAFTFHLYPFNFKFRNLLGRFLQLISFTQFKKAKLVVTTSLESENFLKKNFHLNHTLLVPLGIDKSLYYSNLKKENKLVYLGRIKESKGVYDLPIIMSYLIKDFPGLILEIVGNGSQDEITKLKKLIASLNLNKNIYIKNKVSDQEVREILSKSEILVQPSYEEGFGLSVLEALASGMAIVLYNLPVYEEHFGDFPLHYVPLGNKHSFYLEIKKVLNENKIVNKNENLFIKFSWPEIFVKIFKIR